MKQLRLLFDNFTLALLAVVAIATWLPASGGAMAFFETLTHLAIALLFFLHGAKLSREADGPGKTIVPLQLYFKDGYAKVEIAVGTGKRDWDKRQAIRERDAKREAQRVLANRVRNRKR